MIETSAPGSLMLFGEHAVLHGRLALVTAVHRRMRVRLQPHHERTAHIVSDLGETSFALDHLPPVEGAFRFILDAIHRWRARVPSGFELRIESEFPATIGLGSSAAVTVAALAALRLHANEPVDAMDLFLESRNVIRHVQGCGSGADAAASVFGGVVAYRAVDPPTVQSLAVNLPLTIVYCGYKTPTPEVIRRVDAARAREPHRFEHLFDAMEATATAAWSALRAEDLVRLGACMNEAQVQMEQLGVSDRKLNEIVAGLRARPGIMGAKISGSGLGDCVIGLGETEPAGLPGECIPARAGAPGLHWTA